jgi:ribosomal protein S18 acetylase RimI-like enzyme
VSFRLLSDSEWDLLRDVRLVALSESPTAYLSSYETEARYEPLRWRRELRRGAWLVGLSRAGTVVAVVGATPEPDIDPGDRYLSYLWVAPSARRTGLATRLVDEMLRHLHGTGVARAWLWVLDGNDAARALYGKLGFTSTGERQPLLHDPTRYEERLAIDLARPMVQIEDLERHLK